MLGQAAAFTCLGSTQAQAWTPPVTQDITDLKVWDCYAPFPGRPSPPEHIAFITAAVAGAQAAEKAHGAPAPALAAMAVLESGYGFTRTALFANNYFGWKAKEGDPAAYRLWCQPTASDPNADYVRFDSLSASIDHVAGRLAASPYYKADTARYQADLKAGVAVRTAVKRWVEGISDPYNGAPKAYVEKLLRIMNDPIRPSGSENPKASLYALTGTSGVFVQGAAYQAAIAAIGSKMDPGARYLDACIDGSGAVVLNYPGYDGRPVRACIYKQGNMKGLAYTLHPTKEQLATWIQSACDTVPHADGAACGKALFSAVWTSNNAQFPVAGNVIEDGAAAGCDRPETYYNINFRDGVAVKLDTEARFCLEGQRDLQTQESDARLTSVRYYFVSRVSTLSLPAYETAFGVSVPTTNVKHSTNGFHPTQAWANASRAAHLQALGTGRHSFLDAKARAMFPVPAKDISSSN